VVLPGPALAEIVWVARKKGNVSTGSSIAAAIRAHGVRVEHPIGTDLLRAAELLEISKNNPEPKNTRENPAASLSLADAIILAIVERLACPIVTRDSYWKWLVEQNLLPVNVQTL
jgi:predicted nucleic acid-binding protein